jgi:hypothetical protein
MISRKKLTLLFGLLLGIVAAVLWMWPQADPVHDGKRISEWMRELEMDHAGTQSEAFHTLCHAGTAAAPRLLASSGSGNGIGIFRIWVELRWG